MSIVNAYFPLFSPLEDFCGNYKKNKCDYSNHCEVYQCLGVVCEYHDCVQTFNYMALVSRNVRGVVNVGAKLLDV
jgi:hypothetical protein